MCSLIETYYRSKRIKNQSFHAGDNNDGTVDLTDVSGNLKHIIGLKEIDSFDLVTDNGFASTASMQTALVI